MAKDYQGMEAESTGPDSNRHESSIARNIRPSAPTALNCDQIVTILGIFSYTLVYLHILKDNLQIADKIDYYFVIRRLGEKARLDPESVALSTELQAHSGGLYYLKGEVVENCKGEAVIAGIRVSGNWRQFITFY